jgi:hypothetical protein
MVHYCIFKAARRDRRFAHCGQGERLYDGRGQRAAPGGEAGSGRHFIPCAYLQKQKAGQPAQPFVIHSYKKGKPTRFLEGVLFGLG